VYYFVLILFFVFVLSMPFGKYSDQLVIFEKKRS
jgi:hypothetical protein